MEQELDAALLGWILLSAKQIYRAKIIRTILKIYRYVCYTSTFLVNLQ